MSLSATQQDFAQYVAQLIRYVREQGYDCTLGWAWRPEEVQAYYVEHGLSQTMDSKHTQRLAIDLNLFKDGVYLTDSSDYTFLGDFWCALDGRCAWGGNWTTLVDGNHFEMHEM